MKNRFTLLLVFVFILYSCGNPHLIESDDNKEVVNLITQQIVERIVTEKELQVVNSDGGNNLNFGQLPISIDNKKIIIINNISDKDQNIEIKFDRGQYFYFSGNVFPGINGTCTNMISAKSSCQIEIEFQSSIVGVFEDYLFVINPNGRISIPLSGERKEENKNSNSEQLIFNKNSLGTTLDFGAVTIGSSFRKEVELNNLTEKEVKISDLKIVGSEKFKIESMGDCSQVIPKEGCRLEISFTPVDSESASAKLQVKDQEQNLLSLELKGKGIAAPVCFDIKEKVVKASIGRKSNPKITELPYLTSVKGSNAYLSILYGTDFNVQVKGVSIRTVKDAMVLADFDLSQIPFSNLTSMTVDLDVWKIIADDFKDTELLCLTSKSFKRCSGRVFTLDNWKKLQNPKFWDKMSLSNDLFESRLASTEKKCGETSCEVLRGEMNLKELFGLSNEDLNTLKNDKIVTLVLADDSRFLSLPSLKVKSENKVKCVAK